MDSHKINPIVVRDCADEVFPDTWALDLDGKTLAYVYGEDLAGVLAEVFNPKADPLELLDLMIILMRTGTQLVRDLEDLNKRHTALRQAVSAYLEQFDYHIRIEYAQPWERECLEQLKKAMNTPFTNSARCDIIVPEART